MLSDSDGVIPCSRLFRLWIPLGMRGGRDASGLDWFHVVLSRDLMDWSVKEDTGTLSAVELWPRDR